MEVVIDTINKLQEVFNVSGHHSDVDLPQVVVVGTQSSGKSSVLEHLVGKSFLPRGIGVVTRCPLVLQLNRSKNEEYAVFQHDMTQQFTDYSLICKEIERRTELLAGDNKGICNTPIIVKLYSPSHLDLTLVDLPGLTKVPVGDQPPDIDEQTKSLTLEYVKNPKSIILAVIPANADMATSESLKISRDVDPEGLRTLAVVTKLDIMDEGTSAVDMLSGNVIPVKLGIIGVVNRSQKDINEGKSVPESLIDEAAFFKRRYEAIASQHGTAYLTKSVQKILINHIKTCLPDLKENVSHQLATRRSELKIVDKSKLDKPTQMLDFITKFSRNYCSTIKGDLQNIETTELYGGARINFVFQNTLHKALQSIDALTDLSASAISTAIQNASGSSPALFAPQIAFDLLVKRQMKMLRNPCLICIDLIQQELGKIKQSCLDDQELGLRKYPRLREEMSTIVNDMLRERLPVTNEIINDFIDVQLAYINTAHPDFKPIQFLKESKTETYDDDEEDNEGDDNEEDDNEDLNQDVLYKICKGSKDEYFYKQDMLNNYKLMKECIESYFSIVRKTIQDTVPKMIMHFLVNYTMNRLQSQLVMKLYGSEARAAADLLEESPQVIAERTRLEKAITRLERANSILNSINSPYMPD